MSTNPFNEEKDELGRVIIDDPNLIPKHMTEEEEHLYWEKHAMSQRLLEESIIEEDDDELPPPRKSSTQPISLRMESDLLFRLQHLAELKNIPYQTLLKQFVTERVYEEEKREKVY
ncbi:CopG family antitoxin [Bacillus infantis]|nr:CopG family antitoxin [Bacillus infantis]